MRFVYSEHDKNTIDNTQKLLTEMQEYKLNIYKGMQLTSKEIGVSMANDNDIKALLNAMVEIKKLMMPIGLVIETKQKAEVARWKR